MNIRYQPAEGLIKLMLLYSRELNLTTCEQVMAEKVVHYGNYNGNSMFSTNINYLINNFAPLLYAKFPLQS